MAPWKFSKNTLSVTQQKNIDTFDTTAIFIVAKTLPKRKWHFFANRNMEKYDAHDARVQYVYV